MKTPKQEFMDKIKTDCNGAERVGTTVLKLTKAQKDHKKWCDKKSAESIAKILKKYNAGAYK